MSPFARLFLLVASTILIVINGTRVAAAVEPPAAAGQFDHAIADTIAGFTGTPGTNGWSYGIRPAASAASADAFNPLTVFHDRAWRLDKSAVSISADSMSAGADSAVVRRWRADRAGSIRLVGRIARSGDSAAHCLVCAAGRTVWERDLTVADTIPHAFDILICDLPKDSPVDLVTSAGSVDWRLQILSEPCSGWRPDAPIGPAFSEPQKIQQRDAGNRILDQINQASARHDKSMTIPPGDYRFSADGKLCPRLRNLHNLAIDARGVTFWFEPPLMEGLTFEDCTNISLTGLTMDCDPLPFFQGRITAIDSGAQTVTAEIMPGYSLFKTAGKPTVSYYRPDGSYILNPIILCHWEQQGSQVVVHAPSPDVSVGDYLACVTRTGHLMRSFRCGGMVFQDMNFYTGAGMAVYESGGAGGSAYRRVRVTRRPFTNRLHAFGADGFHFSGLGKGPIVDRCEAAYLGDDVMNLHGQLGSVVHRMADNEYLLTTGSDAPFILNQRLSFWGFIDAEPFGECRITGIRTTADKRQFDVTIDRPMKLPEKTLIDTHRQDSPEYLVKNCWFHDDGQRFLLNGAPNGTIRNNTFQNIEGAVTLQEESWDGWTEGAFPSGTMFRDNRLIQSEQGINVMIEFADGDYLRRSTPIENVTLMDNYIERAGPIQASQVNGLTIAGNVFDQPFVTPRWHGFDLVSDRWGSVADAPIFLAGVARVKIDRNLIFDPLNRTGRRMARLGPMTRGVVIDSVAQWDCVADSMSQWRPTPVQGRGGWFFGSIPAESATGKPYAVDQFEPLPITGDEVRPGRDGYPFVRELGMHPKTDRAVIRRWISTQAGDLKVEGVVQCRGPGGNGTICRICVDGVSVWNQDTADRQPHAVAATLNGVKVGSKIDLVVDAKGDMDSDYTTFYCRLLSAPR